MLDPHSMFAASWPRLAVLSRLLQGRCRMPGSLILRLLHRVVPGVAMILAAPPALAQDWFLHPYGELRAYHGDWLAVCDNAGEGPCRAVQIMLEPGETRVGPARLALERRNSGRFDIVFHHQALIGGVRDPLALVIDGQSLTLAPDQWATGEPGLPNVIAAFHIVDPALIETLVARMKAGRRLTLRHDAGEAHFSLRGVTAALAAIEAQADRAAP
jgi:invasion protein IalB